jgi:hypothetical protein
MLPEKFLFRKKIIYTTCHLSDYASVCEMPLPGVRWGFLAQVKALAGIVRKNGVWLIWLANAILLHAVD